MPLDITFVIPALNEEVLLPKCIRSIKTECPSASIIVVDNGSTDRTTEVALSFPRVTVVHEERKGITHARQAGLLAAQTEWIACIDADSELPNMWYLEACRELYHAKQNNVVALSGPLVFNDLFVLSNCMIFLFYCIGRLLHLFWPMLQGGNAIINRQAMLQVGGFNTDFEFYGEDTETARRLAQVGKVQFALSFYCLSSPRRFVKEGLLWTGTKYLANYLWVHIAHKPLSRTHRDHRASL
jgi:glycosyltransferase involved in cell wall biosynthesis